ncbi:PDZ domain-containing protein [bacterium]|nr:PDZ domain-containing protein [bacterium]
MAIIFFLLAVTAWSSLILVQPVGLDPSIDNLQTLINHDLTDFSILTLPVNSIANLILSTSGNNHHIPKTSAPKNLWESRLYGILLKGTAGSEIAVIQDLDGTNERIVHTGDRIGEARIVSIQRNRLELDGPLGKDTLELSSRNKSGKIQSQSTTMSADTRSKIQVIDRKLIQDMLGQVDKFSKEITLQPVRHADGTPGGFRVSALKPLGTPAKMGLRRNDILTAVNRHQIISIEDVYRVLESAAHKSTLSLSILRNNQKMELNYVLR